MRALQALGFGRLADFDTFRRQEAILIVFNLVVVALLLLVHGAFPAILGVPSAALLTILTALFVLLTLELAWLYSIRVAPSPASLAVHATLSIWGTLGFVFLASLSGEVEDRHYTSLMVLPVISAAFRLSLPGALGVALAASVLNFAAVWYYYAKHPPSKVGEYFEAFNVSLMFLIVGLVVGLLAEYLRRNQERLQTSLDELQQTRDRLVAEEKLAAVGRLSSAIAHEIRNPVAMISSSLATATRGEGDARVREEMFAIAASEAARLEQLTSDFLSYARTRAPSRIPTPVEAALGAVADAVRARAAHGAVRVTVDCAANAMLAIDPYQIHQALLNLTLNALEATPPGGSVRLGFRDAGGEGRLFVENSGAAISAESVPQLFEPFFTTRPRGTGLGLAITRSIARAHGGEAVLEANEAGRVRFEIILPAAPPTRA